LQPVLGDRYDEQRVGALVENLDLDEFLRELGYKEGQTEHALPQGMLTDCKTQVMS
jgi:hypothetical protein